MHSAYEDLGDPTYKCPFCGALMWFAEKVKNSSNGNPEFSLCCNRGKVQLPRVRPPPRLLDDLLHGRHVDSQNFIDNNRDYNMMFAFTSMAGHQDTSVNDGRGPYTYRLGGSNYHLAGSLLPPEGESPKFAQLYMHCGEDEVKDRISAQR